MALRAIFEEKQKMELKGKKVTVVGLGESGLAVCRAAKERGADVHVMDIKQARDLSKAIQQLEELGVSYTCGEYNDERAVESDVLVVSPGVRLEGTWLSRAQKAHVPVMSEIEFAYQLFPGHEYVALTGTNGKSTTTTLVHEMSKAAGKKSLIAGNIGLALTDILSKADGDELVALEVSSFQLETIQTFKPHIGVVLNLGEDHIDWHRSFKNYTDAKAKIFSNHTPDDFAVLNYDDEEVRKFSERTVSQIVYFSQKERVQNGIFCLNGGEVVSTLNGKKEVLLHWNDVFLKGSHNMGNVLAALCCVEILKLDRDAVEKVLKEFKGLPHRVQEVGTINGVRFINDSKATDPHASIKGAFSQFSEPIIAILGGKDKGLSYDELALVVKQKVKKAFVVGSGAEKVEAALKNAGFENFERIETIEEGVEKAFACAQPGDVVLLSPACSSQDMFRDFEHRGDVFIEAVKKLKAK